MTEAALLLPPENRAASLISSNARSVSPVCSYTCAEHPCGRSRTASPGTRLDVRARLPRDLAGLECNLRGQRVPRAAPEVRVRAPGASLPRLLRAGRIAKGRARGSDALPGCRARADRQPEAGAPPRANPSRGSISRSRRRTARQRARDSRQGMCGSVTGRPPHVGGRASVLIVLRHR